MKKNPDASAAISWSIDVSLLGSPIVYRQLCGVLGLSFLLLALLVVVIFSLEGNWDGLIVSLGVVALVFVGLLVLAVFVIVVLFGNRIGMRFILDARGATSTITDSRAKNVARMATLLGLLTGNPSVAGAGVLAQTGASSFVAWRRVQRVHYDDRRQTIYLKSSWRVLAALFCSRENYAEAKARVSSSCLRK